MNREKLERKARDLAFELNLGYWELDFSCYSCLELKREIKKLERIIRQRDRGELYINVDDRQNTYFAIGRIGTLKQWREQAREWLDSGYSDNLQDEFSTYKIKNKDLINTINDMWEIEIVKFAKNVDYCIDYDIEEFTYLGL